MIYLVKMFRMFRLYSDLSDNVQTFQTMFRPFRQCSDFSDNVQNFQSMFRIFRQCSEFSESVQTLFSQCSEFLAQKLVYSEFLDFVVNVIYDWFLSHSHNVIKACVTFCHSFLCNKMKKINTSNFTNDDINDRIFFISF